MDYPYIQATGHFWGSFGYYIADQIAQARRDNAPPTAVYKSHDTGLWVTADHHPQDWVDRANRWLESRGMTPLCLKGRANQ